ncbi:MAG: metallopeptidase family protein, partial [Candidatus Saganbacteria bacterium]|nr:metallopeptidase family protein [Candidatus Saganbacteria bacterium]
METKEFEKYVEQALRDIPKKFRDLMENITVEVDPDRLTFDKSHYLILGQYQGVSLPRRGPVYQGVVPDKIIIYKKAFDSYPPEKLLELIINVLQREIGHYFSMSE